MLASLLYMYISIVYFPDFFRTGDIISANPAWWCHQSRSGEETKATQLPARG